MAVALKASNTNSRTVATDKETCRIYEMFDTTDDPDALWENLQALVNSNLPSNQIFCYRLQHLGWLHLKEGLMDDYLNFGVISALLLSVVGGLIFAPLEVPPDHPDDLLSKDTRDMLNKLYMFHILASGCLSLIDVLASFALHRALVFSVTDADDLIWFWIFPKRELLAWILFIGALMAFYDAIILGALVLTTGFIFPIVLIIAWFSVLVCNLVAYCKFSSSKLLRQARAWENTKKDFRDRCEYAYKVLKKKNGLEGSASQTMQTE